MFAEATADNSIICINLAYIICDATAARPDFAYLLCDVTADNPKKLIS